MRGYKARKLSHWAQVEMVQSRDGWGVVGGEGEKDTEGRRFTVRQMPMYSTLKLQPHPDYASGCKKSLKSQWLRKKS